MHFSFWSVTTELAYRYSVKKIILSIRNLPTPTEVDTVTHKELNNQLFETQHLF